ncbi:PQQ-binding-like beta-propeller repeat protein [Microbulbifer sp. HZ11]|uniref:outer membrane protein assembly factor BamB family protein n=1 Tax=Microbulbifer sp. HZ11 TaxID=1453501 RepID=UPI0005BE062E|nr:PQQ-binding-like beta-propeller repeat protein [Microbulbifer sp. HZ11]
MIIKTKTIFSRGLLLLSVGLLAACGGGGGGGSSSGDPSGPGTNPPPPTAEPVILNGHAIKGPLSDAEVSVYTLLNSGGSLKGDLLASGSTGGTGAFDGVKFELDGSDYFLVEVAADVDTIDISTGQAPVISTLITLASREALESAEPVYATISTTLVLEMMRLHGAQGNSQPVTDSLQQFSTTVAAALGFGQLEGIDLFAQQPLPISGIPVTQEVLDYRTAMEAQVALIWAVAQELGLPVTQVIEWIAADLLDGQYDGNSPLPGQEAKDGSQQVFAVAARQVVGELPVPGTGALRGEDDYLAGETAQILLNEAADIAPSTNVDVLVEAPSVAVLAALGPDMDSDGRPDVVDEDIDGDGILNVADAFPRDPAESLDSDDDGVGDNGDAYPLDGSCSDAAHGNGSQCYLTALADYEVTQGITGADDSVLLVARDDTELTMFRYVLASGGIEEKIDLAVDGVSPNAVLAHEDHGRTYIAYPDGAIRYLHENSLQLLARLGFPAVNLAAAGDYLFVTGEDGKGKTHLTLSKSGQLMHRMDYQSEILASAWSDSQDRLYFRYGYSTPYRLAYYAINSSSGHFDSAFVYSYDWEYFPDGPLLVLDNVNQVVSGSGVQYDMFSHKRSDRMVNAFASGVYNGSDLVTVATNGQGATTVSAYTSHSALYQTQTFNGAANTLLDRGTDYFLVTREASGNYLFHTFTTDRDEDGDGVENLADHFPLDPAASLDSDGDGWPDSWNTGYSGSDSTSGLSLDAYPQDSACQEASQGSGSICDVASALVIGEIEQSVLHENIVYAFSADDQSIYRWDVSTDALLNPIPLSRVLGGVRAISAVVTDAGDILIADIEGGVHRVVSVLPLSTERVFRASGTVLGLISAGPHLLVTESTPYGDRKFNVLDSMFDKLGDFSLYGEAVEPEYHHESGRIFWNRYSLGGQLNSGIIDPQGGYLRGTQSARFDSPGLPAFVAVSPDESRILAGGNTVVRDLYGLPYVQQLPVSESWPALSSAFYPVEGFWWQDLAVILFQNEGDLWLVAYDADLKAPLLTLELGEVDARQVQQYDEGLVYLQEDATRGMVFEKIPLLGDADEDGLPYWWELQYGLSDEDASDAALDPDDDGLVNLDEFAASTSATEADSDADGLSDGDEVLVVGSDPNAQDSDGDLMSDAWELAAGLDPTSADDMEGDLDGDGVANYIEYINGTDAADINSLPEVVEDAYFSFEDGTVPPELAVASAPGSMSVVQGTASHGDYALSFGGDASITWQRTFAPVEVRFDMVSDCYNYYDKNVSIRVDGEQVFSGYPPQSIWQTQKLSLAAGNRELTISITSSSDDCSVYLDNFVVAPLDNVFEMGASFVASNDNKIQFYDYDATLLKEVEVAGQGAYIEEARDIAVLADGRVAVFNGTFEPKLSIYSPRDHEWEHYTAPGWSTINNGTYGGIDAIGERVFVTNMATSGSPNQGIVEFDLGDGSFNFVSGNGYIDLTVGEDGYLYGFTGRVIDKFDPDTMTLVSELTVDEGRSIAVNSAGELFIADWSGDVHKYDSFGNHQAELEVGGSFYDISLRSNGDLLLSSRFENVVLVNGDLIGFSRLSVFAEFVDFTPHLDSDSDGLPDWWEAANGLDANNPADASSDYDLDNLTALEEFSLGTRADKTDTDGDTVSDGDEVLVHGTDPLHPDSDGDGLTDDKELAAGTDPNLTDSDGDGVGDQEELEVHGSDPLASDSDQDGMGDLYEVTHGLNVLVNDAADDADDDGLTNLEESVLGTSPILADTDGDGLTDYDEYVVHASSPLLKDTDGDIMPDSWEVEFALDPNAPEDAAGDLDSDTFTNLEEYVAHTSPTDELDFPMPVVWGSAQGGADHTGYTPWDLDEADFTLRWSKSFPDVSRLHSVAAGDGRVFVSSDSYFSNQRIYGLNAETGEIRWEKAYDDINSLNPPAYADGRVYVQSGGHGDSFIRGLDAETGALHFATAYRNQWSSYLAPTPFAGQLYIAGGYYGGMYSHNAATGSENWFANTAQYDGFTPAVDDQYVYAFITDFAAYDRLTGELAYRIDFPSFDWGGYDVGMATVLTGIGNSVAIQRGTLVVFDLEQRAILWERSGNYTGQPSSHLGQIFAIESGILKVIDESTGTVLWNYEASESLTSNIVVTRTHVFVGGATTTYAIDLQNRDAVWSYAASGALSLSDEGVLYVSGSALTAIDLLAD